MAENKRLPKREEIDDKYKWRLEDIYSTDEDWDKDCEKVAGLVNSISRFRGRLGESAATLLECLSEFVELSSLVEKNFVYARMRRDENNANQKYQAFTDKAVKLLTEAQAAISFINPELISMDEKKLYGFLEENRELGIYKQFIDDSLRRREHVLSQREEEILALSGEMAEAASDIFTMFNNADIKFPYIKDAEGNEVELTKGRYIKFLESTDRRVREDAFHALYSTYGKMKNTLAASLSSNVKRNRFYATVRKYPSALEASLDDENISPDVYNNLIDTVNKNLHLLHRYVDMRKKALKLDELHMYDLYVPIVKEPEGEISYDAACQMVLQGLKPMGEEYTGYLEKAFKSGWIDVYENEGKTSGAYSWGTYLTHPYVLLNYQGTINDVFTIAHEMGHALHSFYTNMTQPYIYSEYKIFVAEVASTVNESLLLNYLINNSEDEAYKAYLINHYLETFRGTVFRQTMFAEFEKIIHEKDAKGESLTTQDLCDIYYELNKKYFGENIVIDEDIAMEWARIPHFYNSFYVYKYATGFSAAQSLSQQILTEGKPAVGRYINFLKSGSSDYPLELLKKAGVDLTTPKPVEEAMKVFDDMLDRMEKYI